MKLSTVYTLVAPSSDDPAPVSRTRSGYQSAGRRPDQEVRKSSSRCQPSSSNERKLTPIPRTFSRSGWV